MCEPTCVWSNRASHGKIRKEESQLIPLSQSFPKQSLTPQSFAAHPSTSLLCQDPGTAPTPTPTFSPPRIQKQEPREPFKLATGLLELLAASASLMHQPVTPKAHPDACIPGRTKEEGRGKLVVCPRRVSCNTHPSFSLLQASALCTHPFPRRFSPSPTFLGCFTDA